MQQQVMITREDLDRLRRFIDMQAKSLFIQVEELRERIDAMEPLRPVPKGRKETLDKIVENLANKVNFLEDKLRNARKHNES